MRVPRRYHVVVMSTPPPVAPHGSHAAVREDLIALEPSRSWGMRRDGSIRLTPDGATIEYDRLLRAPLLLPLGTLQLAVVERGSAKAGPGQGRFPVLKRLSATAVVPREHGLEGWLWTSTSGSALTLLGDEDDAPNAALLFTKPLGEDAITAAFAPDAAAEIAARSPLGAPAVLGLLLRVAEPSAAERAFGRYGLLRPLTDREVPPTMRRSLPTDRSADPRIVGGNDARAATSVAPPGMG
jgi:hypothetical protein